MNSQRAPCGKANAVPKSLLYSADLREKAVLTARRPERVGWVPQISLEEGIKQYLQWRSQRKK